jgi:hypothetical protein
MCSDTSVQILLCADTGVFRNYCVQTLVYADTGACSHLCVQTRVCAHWRVQTLVCADNDVCGHWCVQTRASSHWYVRTMTCADNGVFRHVCPDTGVCGQRRVRTLVCADTMCLDAQQTWIIGEHGNEVTSELLPKWERLWKRSKQYTDGFNFKTPGVIHQGCVDTVSVCLSVRLSVTQHHSTNVALRWNLVLQVLSTVVGKAQLLCKSPTWELHFISGRKWI